MKSKTMKLSLSFQNPIFKLEFVRDFEYFSFGDSLEMRSKIAVSFQPSMENYFVRVPPYVSKANF